MIWALILFVAFMVGTVGPANMVLITAGGRFGVRASLRFLAGIIAGKFLLNILFALGLYELLRQLPVLFDALTYVSAAFMIWLSIRMVRAPLEMDPDGLNKPPGFREGLLVHPLNPKAWAMLTIAWADYGPNITDPLARFAVIASVFIGVQIIFHSLWCLAGARLMAFLPSRRSQQITQMIMAVATVGIVLWVVFF